MYTYFALVTLAATACTPGMPYVILYAGLDRAQTGDGGFASVSHLVRKVCVSPRKNGTCNNKLHQSRGTYISQLDKCVHIFCSLATPAATACTPGMPYVVHRQGMVALPAFLIWCARSACHPEKTAACITCAPQTITWGTFPADPDIRCFS